MSAVRSALTERGVPAPPVMALLVMSLPFLDCLL